MRASELWRRGGGYGSVGEHAMAPERCSGLLVLFSFCINLKRKSSVCCSAISSFPYGAAPMAPSEMESHKVLAARHGVGVVAVWATQVPVT